MQNFFILIESWAVYSLTENEYRARTWLIRRRERERWQEVQAGSRAQAMGMGWQIRNAPLWRSSAPL